MLAGSGVITGQGPNLHERLVPGPAEHRAVNVRAEAGVLQRIPLFAECDRTHLQVLCFSAERIEFATGQAVFRQGARGGAAYLVLQGMADAHAMEGETARAIARLEPGSFAGELAMIAGLPYSVTVTAASRLVTARISRELFLRVATEFPGFAAKVQRALARKLDSSVSDLKGVKSLFDAARPFSQR